MDVPPAEGLVFGGTSRPCGDHHIPWSKDSSTQAANEPTAGDIGNNNGEELGYWRHRRRSEPPRLTRRFALPLLY